MLLMVPLETLQPQPEFSGFHRFSCPLQVSPTQVTVAPVAQDDAKKQEALPEFDLISGWWWLEHESYCSIYEGNNHPNWLSYFSEGFKPPTSDELWSDSQISIISIIGIMGIWFDLALPENGNMMKYDSQMLHGAGIFTYIWVIYRVNVGRYTLHGAFGIQ